MIALTAKEWEVLFDLALGRFDYNDENAEAYQHVKELGLTSAEELRRIREEWNIESLARALD